MVTICWFSAFTYSCQGAELVWSIAELIEANLSKYQQLTNYLQIFTSHARRTNI